MSLLQSDAFWLLAPGQECEKSQPLQHHSSNCQRHVQHLQNCARCESKRRSWEHGSSKATWGCLIYAAIPCAGIVTLALLPRLRQDLFCKNLYTAQIGNAIGPAIVMKVILETLFVLLLLAGLFERNGHSQMSWPWPQLLVFCACTALSALLACALPFIDLMAPTFVCGKTNTAGRSY